MRLWPSLVSWQVTIRWRKSWRSAPLRPRDVLRAFEQRARELDGDEAVTGLDALDARYYPPDRGSPPGEQAMMNLRGVIQRLIGPEL